MARANKGYEIRPMVCDWALDIPMGDATFVLYFNSRNNAELVKAVLEWEDTHPNEATPYQPTLTPPNEWVSRVQELDELYTKLQIVTGFTAEQLLEMFAAGYTLKKPDYSKHFEAMANLAESDPPNDPLTIEQLREMGGQPVYMPETNCWALVTQSVFCPILTFPDGEKCSVYDWYEQVGPVYRRPPEGEEDT